MRARRVRQVGLVATIAIAMTIPATLAGPINPVYESFENQPVGSTPDGWDLTGLLDSHEVRNFEVDELRAANGTNRSMFFELNQTAVTAEVGKTFGTNDTTFSTAEFDLSAVGNAGEFHVTVEFLGPEGRHIFSLNVCKEYEHHELYFDVNGACSDFDPEFPSPGFGQARVHNVSFQTFTYNVSVGNRSLGQFTMDHGVRGFGSVNITIVRDTVDFALFPFEDDPLMVWFDELRIE